MDINTAQIKLAKRKTAERLNVDEKYLSYIGKTEEREILCFDMWYFNVLDPTHEKYKSTVTHIEELVF